MGAGKVVTVIVQNVSQDRFRPITESIREAVESGPVGHAASLSNGTMQMAVGPVSDVAAFAKKLTFGKVMEVNKAAGKITIDAQ